MRYLIAASVLCVLSVAVKAEEPAKYFLGEDGRVTKQEFTELRKEVAELRKEVAEPFSSATKSAPEVCKCGAECCAKTATGTGTKVVPSPVASGPDVCNFDGYPMRLTADGMHWEVIPGSTPRLDRVVNRNIVPANYLAPAAAVPGYAAPIPSYAPTYLPGYSLPAGTQSCPGGRCQTR